MAKRGTPRQLADRLGVHPETVRQACKLGKIPAKKSGRGWVLPNIDAAEEIWRGVIPETPPQLENDDAPKVLMMLSASLPEEYDGRDLDDSAAVEKFWKAKTAEQNYRKAAGELVEREEAQAKYDEAASTAKHRMLGVPSQFQQQHPLPLEQLELLKSMIREALEGLGAQGSGADGSSTV